MVVMSRPISFANIKFMKPIAGTSDAGELLRAGKGGRLGAPAFAAVAIDVENIDDHRQRELVVDSGVSLN
jgi:hypothetical protein